METIKTALVVVVLLAVLYGVYTVLNKPETSPPPEIGWEAQNAGPPQVEYAMPSPGGFTPPTSIESPSSALPPAALLSPVNSLGSAEAVTPFDQAYSTRLTDEPAADNSPPSHYASAPLDSSPLDNRGGSGPPANPVVAGPVELPPVAGIVNVAIPTELEPTAVDRTNFNATENARSIDAMESVWNASVAQVQKGQYGEALFALSAFYNQPEVAAESRQKLIDLLDPLAGKVIYSTEHILEPPHRVQAGENLYDIADRLEVPAQLLANINSISDADSLTPGSELKVLRGPFRGEIDRQKNELVLFLGRYYAGRFPISLGNDPELPAGEFTVLAKEQGHEFTTADGSRIPARAVDNPYGAWWLDLGDRRALHGSPATLPQHGGLGCVSLTETDAFDIFSILSVGSKVSVR